MTLAIFTIHDEKANIYMTPFFFPTQGQALRAFNDLVNDENSTVNKHPEDYRLYTLGTYDDQDAIFTTSTPKLIASATDFISIKATPLSVVGSQS